MLTPPPSPSHSCLAIVLAAGEGARMLSATPKVLHRIAGHSMLEHVLQSLAHAGADRVAVVIGPGREDVGAEAMRIAPAAQVFVQNQRLGTAHAALAARTAIAAGCDDLLIVFADTPLIEPATFTALRQELHRGAEIAVLGFEAGDPAGYGRLLLVDDELVGIREHKDASESERRITLCNAGVMALRGPDALAILEAIGADNAQREYYLTDAVKVVRQRGGKAAVARAAEAEVMGVNDRVQLAGAEAQMQRRLRERAMRSGVTMIAPETVFLASDTKLGRDVLIEPNVFFGRGVSVGEGAFILAGSHLTGCEIGPAATVGPFARLRPGTRIGARAKVGNFVEIKASQIGEGASLAHLAYIGDSTIGARATIGAGTITCNYDGFDKMRCEVGEAAFVGSNSALVAPVKIGAGAYIGSGSVITRDVAPDALAVARGRQIEKAGWAAALRKSRQGKPKKPPGA